MRDREKKKHHTTATAVVIPPRNFLGTESKGRDKIARREFPFGKSHCDTRDQRAVAVRRTSSRLREGGGHLTRAAVRKGGTLQTVKGKGEKSHVRMHVCTIHAASACACGSIRCTVYIVWETISSI
jgi:hypothetical protein